MGEKHRMIRAFLRAPTGVASAIAVGGLLILAIIGPIIWSQPASQLNLAIAGQGPSAQHLFGTDELGRDILARTFVATRLSLSLALVASAISAVLGLALGGVVGLLPPRWRTVGLRLIDVLLSFPDILIAIVAVAVIGPSIRAAVLAAGIAGFPSFARLTSNLASSVAGREFVASARVIGVRPSRLLRRHIMPNISETLVISVLTSVSESLIVVSGLSFLGLGVQPPAYDWGRLLTEGLAGVYSNPAGALAPAGMIAITGLALGLLAEAIARAMNPLLWTSDGAGPASAREERRSERTHSRSEAGHVVSGGHHHGARQPVLSVNSLSVSFPGPQGVFNAVSDVSFDIAEGEIVGVVGESGSGKSMTAMAIARLTPHPGSVRAGSIEFRGEDLMSLPPRRQRRILGTQMSMVFQDPLTSLNPALRIDKQMIEGSTAQGTMNRKAATQTAIDRLRDVHIAAPDHAIHRFPHELSGGMRQRIMIAMGLMNRPGLLIADEPTTALDVTVQAQVIEVLREINRQHGTAILLISHDISVVAQISTRVLVMYAGRIVEDLETPMLLRAPAHPYTRALMASRPRVGTGNRDPLGTIPGRPPRLNEIPAGCAFSPRCPVAVDRSFEERPPLLEIGVRHRAACWVAFEEAKKQLGGTGGA